MEINSSREKEVLSEFSKALDKACKSLGVKLNEGYSRDLENFFENKTEDPKSFRELVYRNYDRRLNLLGFEDDVMIYLVIKGARFIDGNENPLLVHYAGFNKDEVQTRADKTHSKLERAMIYQLNGDFRLFFMASGFLEESKERKEEATELYFSASDIRKRRDGSFSTHGMLFDKLAVRFERYYEIVREALLKSKLKPAQELAIDLSKDDRINILLEKLSKEGDLLKRKGIQKELSILVNMS